MLSSASKGQLHLLAEGYQHTKGFLQKASNSFNLLVSSKNKKATEQGKHRCFPVKEAV